MELQIVIYDLQKKETQLTNEIKLLREKNEQLENHLKSNQENVSFSKTLCIFINYLKLF